MGKIDDLLKRVVKFNDELTSGRLVQKTIWDNEALYNRYERRGTIV